MITEINNLTLKSFKNYSTLPNFFKKRNVIFGHNGKGKSSFAQGIIAAHKNINNDDLTYRFFNTDYVKNSLLLDDTNSKIKGVKVTFSERDADIAKQIDLLNSQIVSYSQMEKDCKEKRTNLRKQIDDLHNKKKGKASINRKQTRLTIEEVLKQYEADLEEALKIQTSKDYIKFFYADSEKLEGGRTILTQTSLPNLDIEDISQSDQDFLMVTLNKTYLLTDNIPSSEVIKWLENGVTLHTSKSESCCQFCNNTFNLQDVKDRISSYNQNTKQKDTVRLEKIKNIISKNVKIIEQAETIKSNLSVVGLPINEIEEFFTFEYLKYMQDTLEAINEKISDMNKIFTIENNIPSFEDEIKYLKDKISNLYTNKLKEIDKSINNIEKLAKGTVAVAIEESDIRQKLKSIQNDEEKISSIIANNEQLIGQINTLKESQSEYVDFMEFLNEILKSLGIQIKLILDNNNYFLKHALEDVNLTIDDISEGEKNLLALLYFYFELYKDNKQEEISDGVKLIVIDDPVSSLDEANKFFVLELVKRILTSKDDTQIFILTHSWDDFCQMTYGLKTNDSHYGLFEIYKNSHNNFQSEIRICQQNIAPYRKLFQEVHQLTNKTVEELDDCDTYHAANSMRRIFEEFLRFKKPNLLPQRSNQAEIENLYYDATKQNLGNNRKRKVGALLTFINVLSHRPIRSEEILENSKTLMNLIKDIDSVHFNAMIVN